MAEISGATIAAEAGGVDQLLESRYDRADDILCHLASVLDGMGTETPLLSVASCAAPSTASKIGASRSPSSPRSPERPLPIDVETALARRTRQGPSNDMPEQFVYSDGHQTSSTCARWGVALIEQAHRIKGIERDDLAQRAANYPTARSRSVGTTLRRKTYSSIASSRRVMARKVAFHRAWMKLSRPFGG
ncbi:MAG: hypothetical protein R3F65_25485 [bacterium]